MVRLSVDIRASLVARAFHHAFTRPVVAIDGVEAPAVWGRTRLPVEPGPHRLAVYFRYRGQRTARLGLGQSEFTADTAVPGPHATARLGPRNGSHFRVTVDTRTGGRQPEEPTG
ncbi:hypothetical protein [Kitasatospora sp. NPDC088351]|uniref:hypothetical protein n=1 Tax=Kitasatospora sp. NPDC088351 TaxID=3155180 RepID=UPI0034213716